MNEEPSPELRALAGALFAAGRAEQPEAALGRRLQLIDPRLLQPASSARPAAPALLATRSRRGVRFRVAAALSAAALLAGFGGAWRFFPSEPIRISAERGRAPWLTDAERGASAPSTRVNPGDAARPHELDAPGTAAASPPARAERPPGAVDSKHTRAAAAASGTDSSAAARTQARAAEARALDASSRTTWVPEALSSGTVSPEMVSPGTSAAPAHQHRAASAQPSSLHAELEQLAEARRSLRSGDAMQALALLDRHERERQGDALVAEATLLRIEALAARGQVDAASDLAARFLRDNPHSALGDRAQTFLRARATRP